MSKTPTKAERQHMANVASLGCIVSYDCGPADCLGSAGRIKLRCGGPATIHHCGTYMGGGRDHMRVIPLCHEHHLGRFGIDGKRMGKRVWEAKYGTEEELLQITQRLLEQQERLKV